jgi:hypothetical protein
MSLGEQVFILYLYRYLFISALKMEAIVPFEMLLITYRINIVVCMCPRFYLHPFASRISCEHFRNKHLNILLIFI